MNSRAFNVIGPVLGFGRTRPDRTALIDGERSISYAELADLICRTSGHLAALGIRRGDRVGLCLKDTADHVILLLASAWLGAVAVPLDWRARPNENSRFIDGLDLKRVMIEPGSNLQRDAIILDATWRHGVATASRLEESGVCRDDPFAISATSGSTGDPKFTMMTHLRYHFAIAGMFELMALSGRHKFLCSMPLYYSGGRNSCLTHLLRGDCVVLYPSLFSSAEYVDVINRSLITVAAIVPSVVRQLLALPEPGPLFPNLTALFCTGAPLHAEEKLAALHKLTSNFNERYGTAETLAISVLRPLDFQERPNSVGQPHSLVEIDIVDPFDRSLPIGDVGLLRIRGPGLGSPLGEAAEKSFRHGWYRPGEIARLDEAGYIFLQGRTSDVIMRSGAKVYPAEVEAILTEYQGVIEAAVIGHRGGDNEEVVLAFVVAQASVSIGALIAHCRTRLTPHKVPRAIRLVDELPKNTAGKIDKRALASSLGRSSAL